MFNVSSYSSTPAITPRISLNRIWHVHADKSYSVTKSNIPSDTLIAIRTLAGEGTLYTAANSFSLPSQSLIILRASEIVSYRTTYTEWRFYWFEFESNYARFPLKQVIQTMDSETDRNALQECYYSLKNEETAFWAATLFSALLFSYLKNHDSQGKSLSQQVIDRSAEYVYSHLNKDVSVEELASLNSVSTRYLHKIFTGSLKVSPKNYIINAKLKTAKELLLSTDLKISSISALVGFQSPYHFCKLFKKHVGITPSDYRNLNAR